ncbi:MAG: RidA family protein, partial [Verrucomicrobiae bacterium]|nr:RidA family protein [Verrucomicrobiae bacterium]
MKDESTFPSPPYFFAPDRELIEEDGSERDHNQTSRTDGLATIADFPGLIAQPQHSVIAYDGIRRLAIMVTASSGGSFRDQAWETLSTIRAILRQQGEPMAVSVQTVFISDAENVPTARQMFDAFYGEEMPLTLFVVQPPCGGGKIAVEAWAFASRTAVVGYHGPHLVTVEHGGLRWIYASAGSLNPGRKSSFEHSSEAFQSLGKVLSAVHASFRDVVRVWLYQGCITETEECSATERYRELNRARTDFFAGIDFANRPLSLGKNGHATYPASTGIGTLEHGLITA